MRKILFLVMCIIALLLLASSMRANADTTTSFSCPSGYAMTIDPGPAPKDDPIKQEEYKPKTAAEKQANSAKEWADQVARTHCVPLPNNQQQYNQQQ